MAPKKKLKLALVSLTGCEGCYFEFLGLREKFIELHEIVDIVEFRLFEDDYYFSFQELDAAFVEGCPLTKKNILDLKKLRDCTKNVIACGSCAHIGGIYHLKNYSDKNKLYQSVYSNTKGIDNLEVKPLSSYVRVDHNLPQCPVNKDEMLRFIYSLIIGKEPKIIQNPVCYECLNNGYECLLKKGEICLGPITQAGCQAICLKSKQACWGCRGLLKNPALDNWFYELEKRRGYAKREIYKVLEVFGVKDLIKEKEKNIYEDN